MIVSASQKSNLAAPFEVELTCVEWSGLAVEEFVLLLGQEDLDSSFCGLVQTLSECEKLLCAIYSKRSLVVIFYFLVCFLYYFVMCYSYVILPLIILVRGVCGSPPAVSIPLVKESMLPVPSIVLMTAENALDL